MKITQENEHTILNKTSMSKRHLQYYNQRNEKLPVIYYNWKKKKSLAIKMLPRGKITNLT